MPRTFFIRSVFFLPLLFHFLPKPKKGLSTLEKIQPYRKMFGQYKGDIVVSEGVVTEEVSVPSADGYMVPVRIYKRTDAGRELPILVYYHGGGFFGGGVQIVEQMCKVLVANLDCVVLNVDYRLCPEAHYPQPFDDCWYVTRWAWEQYGRLACTAAQLEGVDPADLVRVRKNSFGCEGLVADRAAFCRKYPGLTVDRVSLEDIMLFIGKGAAVCAG